MNKKEITFDSFIRQFMVLAVIGIIIYFIDYLSSILIPFFIAWLLAYMLNPIVNFFQKNCKFKNRFISVVVTFIIIGGILTLIIGIAVPQITSELIHLKNVTISFIEYGANNATIPPEIRSIFEKYIKTKDIELMLQTEDMTNLLQNILPKVGNIIWQTANVIINIIASLITLLYLFFLLLDYPTLEKSWLMFVPKSKRRITSSILSDVNKGMSDYFRGQSLIALTVGILFSIGFLIIGFPMAIPLGLFIGFLNLIPYMQIIGIIPTTFLALLKAADTGENFWIIIGCALLVFAVVQTIQDIILTPRIMGHIMGLSPTLILLSLSIWGYLLGIIGLIIALPMTTLMISYYKRYIIEE